MSPSHSSANVGPVPRRGGVDRGRGRRQMIAWRRGPRLWATPGGLPGAIGVTLAVELVLTAAPTSSRAGSRSTIPQAGRSLVKPPRRLSSSRVSSLCSPTSLASRHFSAETSTGCGRPPSGSEGVGTLLSPPLQELGDEREIDPEQPGELALPALALVHHRRDSLQGHRELRPGCQPGGLSARDRPDPPDPNPSGRDRTHGRRRPGLPASLRAQVSGPVPPPGPARPGLGLCPPPSPKRRSVSKLPSFLTAPTLSPSCDTGIDVP